LILTEQRPGIAGIGRVGELPGIDKTRSPDVLRRAGRFRPGLRVGVEIAGQHHRCASEKQTGEEFIGLLALDLLGLLQAGNRDCKCVFTKRNFDPLAITSTANHPLGTDICPRTGLPKLKTAR